MGRKRKKLPLLEQLEIVDAGAGGKAVTRHKEMVVFVSEAVPGDVVDVQLTRKKRQYLEGRPVFFHKYSDKRVAPACLHFGICGGCRWQNMAYNEQLFYKQKQVVDQFQRIAKVELPTINDILSAPHTLYYRNKVEYTFSHRRWFTAEEIEGQAELSPEPALGLHIPGRFDKVIDLKTCLLQPDPSDSIRLAIRNFSIENNYSFFNLYKQEGFLRTLLIRTASTGDVMVVPVFFYDDQALREALLDYLHQQFPEITSLMYIINPKKNDTITDLDVHLYKGKPYIMEQMGELVFKVGPKSFYQINSEQAHNLYQITKDFAQLTGQEVVYDLYTGTGTIACFVADKAKRVVGIEYVPEAIEDAKRNATLNKIDNTAFFAGDMKNVLSQPFIKEQGHPDVLILDPPRAGVHQDVIDAMLFAAPKRIVYVSCNPATQARDVALLNDAYRVVKIQPIDMFPHTHHVENVVLLERRD